MMQNYAHKYELLNTFYWVKQIYPVVFFSSFVYVTILFFNLCGIYKLENSNPIIILGYISLIHFFSYPLFQFGLNGNAVCLLIFPYINLIWVVAVVVGHFVLFVAFKEQAAKINSNVPIHYHFAAAYFINSLILELLLIFFKTQEMKKLKIALETQESDEGRSDRVSEKWDKFSERFANKEGSPSEPAFQTINMGVQREESKEMNFGMQPGPQVIIQPTTIMSLKETKKDTNPFSEKTPVIEKKHPNEPRHPNERKPSIGKGNIRKVEFGKSSNKEQATNLIEAQNSIRNILNKRNETRK